MITRCKPALLVVLLFFSATSVQAKDYLIELIAFKHTAWGDGAPWQSGVLVNDLEGAIKLDEPILPDGFQRLGTGPALADLAITLSDSSRYPLLEYRAWRQPGLPRDAGQAIEINAGQVLSIVESDDLPARGTATLGDFEDYTAMRVGRSAQNALINTGQVSVGQLRGTVTVTLGRYLHVESALIFSELSGERSVFYRDHRRMRSKRTHYIVNPIFGLIVHITPIEEPEQLSTGTQPASDS